jgi:dipeptidyl aminopeptidase/acylaminoacyl peptidase
MSLPAKSLETLINIPFYYLVGSTKDRVVYISNEDGTYSLWSVDGQTGSKFRMTAEPVEQTAEPRHNANDVFFTKDTAKGAEVHKIYRADASEGNESLAVDVPPMRVEGLATYDDMVAFTGATNEEIALYASESGNLEKRAKLGKLASLTDASRKHLVGYGSLANDPRSYELFIFDLSTGEVQEYTPKPGSVNKLPKLKDSRVLFESDFTGKNRLHIYEIETHELSGVTCAFQDHVAYDATEHPYFDWTDDGRIWFVGKKDGEASAFIDGKKVPTPQGYLWGLALQKGKAYVSHTMVIQPLRVLEIDLETAQTRIVIDNPLPIGIREKFGRSRFVRYQSFDGRSISALVVDDGTGVPKRTITYVHGGPWFEVLNSWGVFLGSLALMGYNIIAPNFRGSTGYGEDYRKLDIGDPGGGDLKDVLFAARWAKDNNIATDIAILG